MNEWLNQSINQSVRRSCSKSYPGYISVNWTLNMHQKLVFGRTHLLSMSSEPSSKFLICSAADYVLAPHSQPLDVFYNSRFHGMLHSICLMLLFLWLKSTGCCCVKVWYILGSLSREVTDAGDGLPKIPIQSIAYDDARQLLPYVCDLR